MSYYSFVEQFLLLQALYSKRQTRITRFFLAIICAPLENQNTWRYEENKDSSTVWSITMQHILTPISTTFCKWY